MQPAPRPRRLSAVLFLDVVGSTQVASDLGDRRWRELLTRFRRTVRAVLKRYGGHEEDTAGDGFFATFGSPEPAVRAADAIVREVQAHGVDVRCGVHFGECEVVDGKLAGIAVHVGARVMSLAGPAEVLVTSTVRDLVAGSGMVFEDLSAHELKGVPGTWQLFALREIDGNAAGTPLTGTGAAERLAAVTPPTAARRRGPLVAGLAAAVLAGGALWLLFGRGGGDDKTTTTAAPTTPSTVTGSPTPTTPARLSEAVVKLDPDTGEILMTARNVLHGGLGRERYLAFGEGAVWAAGNGLAIVDPATGKVRHLAVGGGNVAVGDREVWVATASGSNGTFRPSAVQIDPATFRPAPAILFEGSYTSLLAKVAVGGGYVWLAYQGVLGQADPGHGEPVTVPIDGRADNVSAFGQEVWVADFLNGVLYQIDPLRSKVERSVTLQVAPDSIAVGRAGLWVVNTSGHTAFEVDELSGDPQPPVPVGAGPISVAVGTDAVWVANRDDDTVTRIDPATRETSTFEVPGTPLALAVDPRTDAVWVYLI
jgi:class 3 adenylate cyclase/streptogramin lyase